MVMTDDEIVSAAARLRAAKRRRVTKACEVCGRSFEGIAQRRYCSDACRIRASRRRAEALAAPRSDEAMPTVPRDAGEPKVDSLDRVRDELSGILIPDDSTEIVRWSRIERTAELLRAGGHADEAAELVADYAATTDSPWSRSEAQAFLADLDQIRATDVYRRAIAASEADTDPPPPPRGEHESVVDYFDRMSAYLMQGRVFTDDSADLIRESREERTAELLRAAGLDPVSEE